MGRLESSHMKIAMIAPVYESIPARKYGGTERVVYELTEGLVKRGIDVTLFASGDSLTSAKLCSIVPKAIVNLKNIDPYGLKELHMSFAYDHHKEFDLIHDHHYVVNMPLAAKINTPIVNTVHNGFHAGNYGLFSRVRNVNLVTISKSQIPTDVHLNIAGTVYNGEKMDHFPFSNKHQGYLLYVGRIHEEKGIHHAIEAAHQLDLPLILAGKVGEDCLEYFNARIKDKIDGKKVRWVGEVDTEQRNELMKNAICMLHPVTWPELFGLTLIEAMACGLPVIAFNKGSISEIIQHRKTGYIVNDVQEMVEAVNNIRKIDRAYCRKYALKTFSSEKMVDGYIEIYQKVLAEHKEKRDILFKNSYHIAQNYSLGNIRKKLPSN